MVDGCRYCDIALPVPIDRLFTYELPLTMRHRVRAGCRVLVPFAARRLTGVVVELHGEARGHETREALKLVDEEPVLDGELLNLGHWIAEYYCAPIGEVLKGMLPLSGETRRGTRYSLTEGGRDVARQLIIRPETDSALQVLGMLEERSRSAEYLSSKVPQAKTALRGLIKRGWVMAEATQDERDPLRASAERLQAEFIRRQEDRVKLKKNERELLAFLELHPGEHNLAELGKRIKKASEAARSLARRELIKLEPEGRRAPPGYERPIPILNAHQEAAFDQIRHALEERQFKAFLLQGVTGSGKTEVYLRSIEAALAMGKNALLLVPEIALTPAVAGQFFHRFGKQVAILHSAFGDAERAEQWRRIRNGQARVVVGTRSGVFAPVQNLGLVIVDEEHDGSYKQQETPRYHGRDVALIRAKNACAVAVLGSATPSIESRWNAEHGKYSLLPLPERIAQRPLPEVQIVDMRMEFLETQAAGHFFPQAVGRDGAAPAAGRANDAAIESPRVFEFHGVPGLWRTPAVRELFRGVDPSPPRPAHAVPLLRICGEDSSNVPKVRKRLYTVPGYGLRARGGGIAPAPASGADCAAGQGQRGR